jgi:hypothetical protein
MSVIYVGKTRLEGRRAYCRSCGWTTSTVRYLNDPHTFSAFHTSANSTIPYVHTSVVDSNINLLLKYLLNILDRLVNLGTRVDVAFERLDLNAEFLADRLGNLGGVRRGVSDGDISTSCG